MNIDFEKSGGLVPVIIQDSLNMQVLMLGYMNKEALEQTQKEGIVTFFSRSRQSLWTKGSTSGNYLQVQEICSDCDQDALLIKVKPAGPVCHTGSRSCFAATTSKGFLYQLEAVIAARIAENNADSYTNKLFRRGINKMAQKVGEEAVELVIEAKDDNEILFKEEAADLLYHLLILLKAKSITIQDIEEVLEKRHSV